MVAQKSHYVANFGNFMLPEVAKFGNFSPKWKLFYARSCENWQILGSPIVPKLVL